MPRRGRNLSFFIMEKAIILFKDPENNKSIEITLNYNKKNSSLDYDLKLSENYSMTENMDFIGFLAHTFLSSLQTN